jgi:branched-chain amino acid transport system ATP-binding protein
MINIFNLVAAYGGVEVLHRISLHLDPGEIVAVLGPNGAGKSTLLKTIMGLLHPRSGEISFEEKRIDRLPPEDILLRGIALVPEGRRIFSGLTVLENLRLGAYTQPNPRLVEQRLNSMFERFSILADRRHQTAGTLSGGEQQQLAIARALMSNPKVILLDEPSLGLAPVLVEKVFALLKELRTSELSMLLVEQNTHQALDIADRAYVLANGVIQAEGTGKEFLKDGLELERAYLGGKE